MKQPDTIRLLEEENKRYREALEKIFKSGKGIHVEIAREALNAL